jgi:hypothetical protein
VTFLSAAVEELGARRKRLQLYFKPFFGGLIEFALFSGFVLGAAAAFLGRWYGLLPLAAFVIGYGLLEQRRQRVLAAGAGEDVVRPRYDRLILAMTAALAALGVWAFAGALHAKDAVGWTAPPPKTINLDLVTE